MIAGGKFTPVNTKENGAAAPTVTTMMLHTWLIAENVMILAQEDCLKIALRIQNNKHEISSTVNLFTHQYQYVCTKY